MRCPNCGREATGRFCSNCGARLDSPTAEHEHEPELDAGSTRVIQPEDLAALVAREAGDRSEGAADAAGHPSTLGEANPGGPAATSIDATKTSYFSAEQLDQIPSAESRSTLDASDAGSAQREPAHPEQRGFLGWLKALWSGKGQA